jgi:hypothetical protein
MATTKPGNLNPDSSAKGSLGFGQSSQNAIAGANKAAGAGKAAYQLYQGKTVRIGTFESVQSAEVRAAQIRALQIGQGDLGRPQFRIIDSITKKTLKKIW